MNPALWVKNYGNGLFSYALLKTGSRETAQDLVQETFVSAIRGKENFQGLSSEKTWLFSILKNKIIDYYRKKDVLKNAGEYLAETDEEFSQNFFEKGSGHWIRKAAPGNWTTSADMALNQKEFEGVVQNCLEKMPSRLMPIFVAKFIDDEDSEEICKVHNLSSSNYWVIIHRAKVLFRACLEKNWFLK